MKDKKRERNDYQRMYRMFFEAKKNAKNWLAIIGMIKVDEDNDIFVGHEACEEGDEQRIVSKKKEEKIKKKRMSVQEQISEMLELIDKCVFDDEELKSFSSEGIFCYSNGMIKRASVQKYRTGKAWN